MSEDNETGSNDASAKVGGFGPFVVSSTSADAEWALKFNYQVGLVQNKTITMIPKFPLIVVQSSDVIYSVCDLLMSISLKAWQNMELLLLAKET